MTSFQFACGSDVGVPDSVCPLSEVKDRVVSEYRCVIVYYQVKFQWKKDDHRSGETLWVDCTEHLGQTSCLLLGSTSS